MLSVVLRGRVRRVLDAFEQLPLGLVVVDVEHEAAERLDAAVAARGTLPIARG